MNLTKYILPLVTMSIMLMASCRHDYKASVEEVRGDDFQRQAKMYLDSLHTAVLPVSVHDLELATIHLSFFLSEIDEESFVEYGVSNIFESGAVDCGDSDSGSSSEDPFVLHQKGYHPYDAGPMLYFSNQACHLLYVEIRNAVFDGKMPLGGGEAFLFLFNQENRLDTVYQIDMHFN